MSSGIYYIINKINNKKYIGSSKNIEKRFRRHLFELNTGTHHNIILQRSFDKHGVDNFDFLIIEETNDLFEREQAHIDNHNSIELYNIGGVGGGDNLTNNPNKVEILQKMSLASKKMWDDRTPEERSKLCKFGENNPNYGKKWTDTMKESSSKMVKERYKDNPETLEVLRQRSLSQWQHMSEADKIKFKEKCRERMLKDNPFKGKKHNNYTLSVLSEKGKERFVSTTSQERYKRNPQTVLVTVCGKLYYGLSEAGRQLGISPALMLYRLKSKSEKWKDYQYVTVEEDYSENGNDILG